MARWRSEAPAPLPPETSVRDRVRAVDPALAESDRETSRLGYVVRDGVRYPVASPTEGDR